ncbi:MAG: LAGLIDADG family homing endonuclease [Candidatus Hadarchaeaceae archaeon]
MRHRVYTVNTNFFKEWNPQMAYVLGLTFSDGSIYRSTLSWELRLGDKGLLFRIRNAMKSDYPIRLNKKRNSADLRISNLEIVKDLKQLGFIPGKIKFPSIPQEFSRHFARGFLDGDGWITTDRRDGDICIGFSNRRRKFLEELIKKLNEHISLTNNHLRRKMKVTRKNKVSITYQIEWYGTNAFNILKFFYDDLKGDDLYLERKYRRQLEARDIYMETRKSMRWREVERTQGVHMEKLLFRLLTEEKLNGVQMAKTLGVSSAAVYRWLEKTGIRRPVKKVHREIRLNCFTCGRLFESLRKTAKYCSLSCVARSPIKRIGKIVKCAACGKEIYRAPWWFRRNSIPFCSRACIGKWQKMRLRANLLSRCKISGRFLHSTTFREAVLSGCTSSQDFARTRN